MDPKIRNFRGIERLIREDPRRADNLAFEWQRFLKSTVPTSPELLSIETADDFHKWAQTHPEKHIDTSIFVGKEVADSYYYLRELNEERQMQRHGNIDPLNVPTELLALPILAASFLERPKTMEEDKDYQKIEARLKKEWLKKNPGKDLSSKEGVDYLYGRINPDPLHSGAGEDLDAEEKWEKSWAKSVGTNLPGTFPTLSEEAEREFRNNPKFAKRIERYDKERKKIYKNPKNDPLLRLHNSKNQNHLNARIALSQKEPMRLRARLDEIERMIQVKSMTDFSDKYPEKAMAYDSDNHDKNKQRNNIDTKTLRRIFQSESKAPEGELKIPLKNVLERPSVRSLGRSANSIGRSTARVGGRLLAQGGRVAAQLAARAAVFLFTTPVGWIILAVLAIVIITFAIVFAFGKALS